MDEPDLTIKTVICRTTGCDNAGIPLTLACADTIICGPCGQQITDITVEDS